MKKKSVWGSVDRFVEAHQIQLLLALLILAFSIRIIHLGTPSMWIDETISALAAKGILDYGYPLLASGEGYFRAELFHYLMAFFMLLFGENDFGARFVSVIFGVATVALGFFLGKKLSNGNVFVGFVLALFLTFSSLEIIYSKQARFYQAFQFFYFLSFYLFYKFILLKEKLFKTKYLDYSLLILSILATLHLQVMGLITIPLFFLLYTIYNHKSFSKIIKQKSFWVLSFFVALVSFYLLFRLFSILNFSYLSRVYFYGELYLLFYLEYLPIFILSIVGIIVALRDDWKTHLSFVLYSLVPFLGLFLVSTFATRYVYFMLILLFFYLIFLLSKVQFKYVFVLLVLLFYSSTAFSFTGIEYPRLDPSMPDANYEEAYIFLEGQEELTLISTWPQATMWYYGKGPDYWINYSIAGYESSPWMYTDEGYERFTNAQVINNVSEFPDVFHLVLDRQATGKIKAPYRDFVGSYCGSLYVDYNIVVYKCNSSFIG